MNVAFYTLGCKANQFETQALEKMFTEKGHCVVPFASKADAYIINTCTVTASGDKKSRNAAYRARALNPDCILVVCGCYAQVKPEEVRSMCSPDVICGTGDKSRIIELTEKAAAERIPLCTVKDTLYRDGFDFMPAGSLKGRTRALLKVQDGCQNFCSYCLIPYARGLSRSLPLDIVISEAQRLSKEGYLEIVITGIEISSYGFDLPDKPGVDQMISAVCSAAPSSRIRLGSLEPRTITEEFCRTLSRYPNLCPHFHLSLQSGCDRTLKAMNRKYDTKRYLLSCQLLREYFPGCAITTDLIVGFPGETEEDFANTLDFIRKCGFSQMHIFPYSSRPGTAAASMEGQLTHAEKQRRAARALKVADSMKSDYLQNLIGNIEPVLFEQKKNGLFSGHTTRYCLVKAPGEGLSGKIANVRIESSDGECLLGSIIPV